MRESIEHPRKGPGNHRLRILVVVALVLATVVGVLTVAWRDGNVAEFDPGVRAPAAPISTPPPAAGRIEDIVLNGQGVVIATPPQATNRAVLFLHGSGQNSRSLFTDPVRKPVVDALLAAGFAVAASDAHLENWGSQAGVDAHLDLAAELRRRGLAEIAVLAESMGALSLPGVVAGVRAKAAGAWYPVCNLASVIRTGRFNQAIAAAYGGSLQPPAGLSPLSFAVQPSLRLAIWASPADTVVPSAENADVCAAQARAAGIQVTQVQTQGDHGDPSNIQPDNIVRFFTTGPG